MNTLLRFLAISIALVMPLSACSAQPVELGDDAVIIDVRTPEEFATGHLEGAVNIDVQSSDFAQNIMQLDKDGEYFVYCRSGNRSGQAISQMAQMGFADLTNGGSVQDASTASGIEIVVP